MGIGMNFICNCCNYDTGLLMLNQGNNNDIPLVISQFISTYSNEIDLEIVPQRKSKYQGILTQIAGNLSDLSTYVYTYEGCVCYHCQKTYESLDILKKKEEQVYVGKQEWQRTDPLQDMFDYSSDRWISLLENPALCLFCDYPITKLKKATLSAGVECPKCATGLLEVGEEFQLWD
jgi:hypothetical protein